MSYVFQNDNREIRTDTPEPPRRMENMLYNRRYMTQIDQTGAGRGFYQDPRGRVCNAVSTGRVLYVRDAESGRYFSVGFDPVWVEPEQFACTAGLGYQIIENCTDGLAVTWRIYVPVGEDPVEIWDVRVADRSGRDRSVQLFTLVEMNCDGVDTYGGSMFRIARYLPEIPGIFVRTDAAAHKEMDFPVHNGFFTADREADGWDANLRTFIGPRRTKTSPQGLEQGRCHNSYASMEPPTGTLQMTLSIPAGQSRDLRFVCGACAQPEHAAALRSRYIQGSLDADAHFDALRAEKDAMTENIQLSTPAGEIDRMSNAWVKQQVHFGATWVRWGYMGYRDIVQQAMGVLTQDADLARADLLAACAHQYADGFALRGWHPLDPMRYADSAQWLISSITEYVKETGELDLFDVEVPYFDQGAGSVYEHLDKAIERLHTDTGPRGMCLAFFGDWNDSLTGVCREGRGESVWLTMAFCRGCRLMAELARTLGRGDDADRYDRYHAEMARAINQNAWDGRWYLCAIDDDGNPIGSKDNDQGRIFLNMQSWAILGDVADADRAATAIDAVYEHLDSGWGLMLNWPAYTRPADNVGRLSYIRPGSAENASVYTHGNAFMLLALLQAGRPDAAVRLWKDVRPGNPNRPVPAQPNVFANGYLGPDSDKQPGRPEHMWVTGSAAWMFYNVVEYLLGLRRGYDGIRLQPHLPSEWTEASIRRIYRGTTYHVRLTKPAGVENPPVRAIRIDGAEHPVAEPLPITGQSHRVEVELGQ